MRSPRRLFSRRSLSAALVLIAVLAVVALAAGCAEEPTSDSSGLAASASPSPAPAAAGSAAELYADLVRAIESAAPSLSPEELDGHIRALTGAPYSIIVAPYDPAAESESESFSQTVVASSGIDGALATDLAGFVHDSQGRPVRATEEAPGYGAPLWLAGHLAQVGGRDGYVLIAMPAE